MMKRVLLILFLIFLSTIAPAQDIQYSIKELLEGINKKVSELQDKTYKRLDDVEKEQDKLAYKIDGEGNKYSLQYQIDAITSKQAKSSEKRSDLLTDIFKTVISPLLVALIMYLFHLHSKKPGRQESGEPMIESQPEPTFHTPEEFLEAMEKLKEKNRQLEREKKELIKGRMPFEEEET